MQWTVGNTHVTADHFSVFSADEALEVNNISPSSTVVIMGYIGNEELEWAILNDIEFFVFERDRMRKALEVSRKFGKKAKIHLEFETGLNRTGFDKDQLEDVLDLLSGNEEYF